MTRWKLSAVVAALLVTAACADTGDEGPELPEESTAAATAPDPDEATLLDPSAASMDELMSVPGLDHAAAEALVASRPYGDMLGVDSVLARHLGEEQRDSVYTRVWMPIDLNAAAREEILLIPGVGERMAHEFEEYRPYRGIAEFRREIGKYVDEQEVARLERYVQIR
ncbi:MAG TPA: hypothetical protein VMK65_06700 [Longimicrobiales bacterium]|nr:hypothetical protein [Longimicrobiales bacterium]